MSQLNLQTIIRNIHIWVGLIVGIVFCVMSLSGSLLIFRADIDKCLRPHWTATSPVQSPSSLNEVVGNIARRWPDSKIVTITLPDQSGDPYEIEMQHASRRMRAFADSKSGEVLGTHGVPWLAWLVDLHHDLLLGTKQASGIVGLLLFFTSLTGLVLSMVRPRNWRTALRVQWGASWKQVSFELHRATGLLGYVLLLVVSLSGIYLGFPNTIQRALGVPPPAKQPKNPKAATSVQQPLVELLGAAQRALPGGTIRQIRLGDPVAFRVWLPGDPRPGGNNRVDVGASTGLVVQMDRAADWGGMKRFTQWIAPVHYAEWGGLPLKILWSFIGIIPPILFVSGVMIWLRPYLTRRQKRQARKAIPLEEFVS